MQCPKCHADMATVNTNDIPVDSCGKCGGLWFDLREHEHLIKAKGFEVEMLDTAHPERGREQNAVRDIDCPRCNVKMVKLAHHEQRHIDYEQCATCGGVYLDAGEFDDLRSNSPSERIRRALPRLLGTRHAKRGEVDE